MMKRLDWTIDDLNGAYHTPAVMSVLIRAIEPTLCASENLVTCVLIGTILIGGSAMIARTGAGDIDVR